MLIAQDNPTHPDHTPANEVEAPPAAPVVSIESQLAQLREELTAQYQQQIEALNQRLSQAEAQAQQAQSQRWRLEAVAREGLPTELADRLQGDNAEALAQDAARLAKLFPVRKSLRTGHAAYSAAPTRAEQIFARIEGRGNNVFDILLQRNLGGGAFGE